jgi:DNA (cytosine-5)-methyltransferase 1
MFFLAENVAGMTNKRHEKSFQQIIRLFFRAGYDVYFKVLDAYDYSIAQNRKRIFFIGFRKDLKIKYSFPEKTEKKVLKDIIWDLKDSAISSSGEPKECKLPNHEYLLGSFSSIYMSRNRVRKWEEPSFTIQASGRHAPLHPQAPKMIKIGEDKRIFVPGQEELYRRLSIRECARIQSFPDNFIFYYKNLNMGYKMVGNAVPVHLAFILAESIRKSLSRIDK